MDLLEVLYVVLTATYSFFCVCAYLVFLHCFYDPGFQWHKRKAAILAGVLLVTDALAVFSPLGGWVDIVRVIFLFSIAIYDYQGKKLRGFFRLLLTSTIIEACFSVITTIGTYLIVPDSEFLDPSPAVLLWVEMFVYGINILSYAFLFFYLYYRLYKPGIVVKCGIRELLLVAIYPIVCFVLSDVIFYFGKESATTLIILTCLSILFALMFPVFMYYTRISRHFQQRTAFQETYMQAELTHFQQYRQAQEETRLFRHDIRNNLLCMRELLQQGNTEEASLYLQDLLKTTENLSARFVSGDEMLDCILGVKAGTMDERQIPFQLDGVLAGGLGWKPADICSVFANALDNAIEACSKLPPEKRYITMQIRSTAQYWFITVLNPVKEAVDTGRLFRKKSGYTSKADQTKHGIGTYNMKHTAESYGAIVKAECTDQVFKLEIMIDKSSS